MGDKSPTTSEYAVRIPANFLSSVRESCSVQPTPLRNLHKDFMDVNDEMQVYVRIKPSKDENNILSISGNHIIVHPSKDSVAYKNRNNAGTKMLQKFKFNKIYDTSTTQDHLFRDSALNLVQDFLLSKNTLVFTYGATSAGKTYTMLGTVGDAGLIPRSLDCLFNSLEDRLLSCPMLKPLALNEVMKLNPQQTEAEEMERSLLMKGFDVDMSDTKDSIASLSNATLKDWNIRAKDDNICNLQYPNDYYSVWVTYCEIYNEQVFDLLESCDKRKKRVALRVTEDKKGKFYVKGLKEICVRTADDAVRVLLFGKENLHFAATKLNHNSSRSHCVFTVKIIRTNDSEDPTEAAVNMMSFCDLAGMERTTKTQSRGDRLKEAGNINTSLLILGRCIDAMRINQQNPNNKMIIPFRESKLTRILQTFLSGQGRAAMFVNVSPSSVLCDETLHVLKFGALAQEVVIQPSDRDASIADCSMSQFAPPMRPSRFQQYVRKSISILSARASVLEQPSFQVISEDDESQDRILFLEGELSRMKSEWDDNEQKIRDECCNEWSAVVTKMESTWNQRYEDTKARYEEFCENRVNLMTNLMNNCMKKRKVSNGEYLENFSHQLKDKDDRIDTLEDSNLRLSEQVEKLKKNLKISEDGKAELQREMTRLQFEKASTSKPKINFCGPEIEEEETELSSEKTCNLVASLQKKLATKEEMLNEAVIEFHSKNEEVNKLQRENEQLKTEVTRLNVELADFQSQLEKSNLLLSDANERLDVREEELMNLEEKLMKANGQYGNINTELREARRKIRDYENRFKEQNNVSIMQNMCEDQQKQLLQTESLLEKRKEEIDHLNQQLSKLKIQVDSSASTSQDLEQLRDRYTKVQIQLSIAHKDLTSLQVVNEDMKTQQENLLDEISHLKKDMELSSSERKQDESGVQHLLKDNERLRLVISELRDIQTKLTGENQDFQKTLAEYESTVRELTAQMEKFRETQRNQTLMEEELSTLAATLGRVQLEKNQIEKDNANIRNQLEKIQNNLKTLQDENSRVQKQYEDCEKCKVALEIKLNDQMKELEKCDQSADSLSNLTDELKECQTKLKSSEQQVLELEECLKEEKLKFEEQMAQEEAKSEKVFKDQFDAVEKDNEKLTKDMLKHLRRADQLSLTVNTLKEELNQKTQKCESLLNQMKELESQCETLTTIQSQLIEKESAVNEKNTVIAQLTQQTNDDAQVLSEKNTEINRLETELKLLLSGHVGYKKTEKPQIKVEKHTEEDQSNEEETCPIVTPTPAKARRGRSKKVASPSSVQKENEVDENKEIKTEITGSTRSRRTLKTDFSAPTSSTKTSGRKGRKPKIDDEAAHPALYLNVPTSSEDVEAAEQTLVGNTKRRLYNSKFPDVLLPSSETNEIETAKTKRMTTRASRK